MTGETALPSDQFDYETPLPHETMSLVRQDAFGFSGENFRVQFG
jgi:hypothetical protein